MCGIIGHLSTSQSNERNWLISARDKMIHRGPNSGGYFLSRCQRVEFGQRRLSILDLSNAANQPFTIESDSYEYSITFNGEVYNFLEIRNKLQLLGVNFNTDSDTEVVLRSYIFWGEECLREFEGMFSFAIYNQRENKVFIARDIVGEKPLYYAYDGSQLFFASEFLAIHSHQKFDKIINLNRIFEYLELGFLPNDKSFCDKILKLKPAHFILFDLLTGDITCEQYHSIYEERVEINKNNKKVEFDNILNDVVSQELRSDVPIGVLLSGGVDSSIIACKINERTQNVTNFTVDFGDNTDELSNARLISKKYGIKHEVLQFKELNIDLFEEIIGSIDEPIADSSYIPTFLVSEMIKSQGVTVVLGGDGADEIFGGYSLYSNWNKILSLSEFLPIKGIGNLVQFIKPSTVFHDNRMLKWLNKLNHYDSLIPNIREVYSEKELTKMFNLQVPLYGNYYSKELASFNQSPIENLMIYDLFNYFSSNILLKNDRASMQNSLELRAPFLNKKIIQFGFTNLSLEDKVKNNDTKVFLKDYTVDLFPNGYNYHTKRGFNFTENMVKNADWEKYFQDKIDLFGVLFNCNDAVIKKLLPLYKSKKLDFTKIYSIIILSNWISKNSFKIST